MQKTQIILIIVIIMILLMSGIFYFLQTKQPVPAYAIQPVIKGDIESSVLA